MRIASDGRWFHQGSEIHRPEMVKLFSTILRRDGTQHYLVTPAEKLSIDVDDAPFLAVDMEAERDGVEQRLALRTNVDDLVEVDARHPISMKGSATRARPYVVVRDRLEALIARSVYYRLAELSVTGFAGRSGVWSNGIFFELEVD